MMRRPDDRCPACGHLIARHGRVVTKTSKGHCLECSCPAFFQNNPSSGEHQAVRQMRAKFESIAENTIPVVEALNTKIDGLAQKASSHPPPSEDDLVDDEDTSPGSKP